MPAAEVFVVEMPAAAGPGTADLSKPAVPAFADSAVALAPASLPDSVEPLASGCEPASPASVSPASVLPASVLPASVLPASVPVSSAGPAVDSLLAKENGLPIGNGVTGGSGTSGGNSPADCPPEEEADAGSLSESPEAEEEEEEAEPTTAAGRSSDPEVDVVAAGLSTPDAATGLSGSSDAEAGVVAGGLPGSAEAAPELASGPP